jgi:bifunctional DNase/RNase
MLVEAGGERRLPIWIGLSEAAAISTRLGDIRRARPQTHDLAASLVAALGGQVTEVKILRLEGRLYYAEVVLERDGESIAVDARPSDSIAIALQTGAAIFVAEELLQPSSGTPREAGR